MYVTTIFIIKNHLDNQKKKKLNKNRKSIQKTNFILLKQNRGENVNE